MMPSSYKDGARKQKLLYHRHLKTYHIIYIISVSHERTSCSTSTFPQGRHIQVICIHIIIYYRKWFLNVFCYKIFNQFFIWIFLIVLNFVQKILFNFSWIFVQGWYPLDIPLDLFTVMKYHYKLWIFIWDIKFNFINIMIFIWNMLLL
jgi:hypothetical protein